jgi:pyruvate/2-oxoglutarate dehydrogenase complex dihydrolipoamide dehydrogenase (E3) component
MAAPLNVLVIGAGPAGTLAAMRAAELGAKTTLVTRDYFGGMAANDGPIPVRTLAHAARLIREARQLGLYGIAAGEPVVDYSKLLARVRDVVAKARAHSSLREEADRFGVTVREDLGPIRFADPQSVEAASGERFEADRFILCAGGKARRLQVPGAELTATHSDAWGLTAIPPSLLVIGAGMTGLQVASIFQTFGSQVQLFQAGPRILEMEDEDVSREVAAALRDTGVVIRERFGTIESFEKTPGGVRMRFSSKEGRPETAEAALAVATIGWLADTAGLNLGAAGVKTDARGFVATDEHLRTSAPHIFAAGDITGRHMLVPPAVLDGYVAGTNAVRGTALARAEGPFPIAGFTDPGYGHVGMAEAEARAKHDIVVGMVRFTETARHIIDGRTVGFCKLIVDRGTRKILGCHVVGERAADIVQAVSIVMSGGLDVNELARVPLAYPTYVGTLTRAAYYAARQIDPDVIVPAQRAGD